MNLVQLIVGYLLLALPQVYEALVTYNTSHPNVYIAILISILGGVVLHKAEPK